MYKKIYNLKADKKTKSYIYVSNRKNRGGGGLSFMHAFHIYSPIGEWLSMEPYSIHNYVHSFLDYITECMAVQRRQNVHTYAKYLTRT